MVAHTLVVVDELAETAAANPKRLATIVEKMYVHFLKSAASLGNQGMKLMQNHSTLTQGKAKVAELLENTPWAQQSNSVREYIPVHDDE